MLRELRAQVNALLADTPVRRKPALRRSDAPGALLATDLPYAADEAATADFIARAEAAQWSVRRAENGWLLLDRPVPMPDAPEMTDYQGECGCCLWLLRQHPDNGDAAEMIRQLVRAQEKGPAEIERFCGALHASLAAMLRRGEALPGSLAPYLAAAYQTIMNGRLEG